jgi:7-carboxy-7-deazaguanine synthase
MKKLAVSEIFYSIQGEGQTMGIPAVFLRLGGCNLLCESASWVCDTIEVWRNSKATQFKDVICEEWVERLQNGAHLVITGGEPLMHQRVLPLYLQWFEETHKFLPTIEIETNGTIVPNEYMLNKVTYWNVSPKLENAGEQNRKEVRINPDALKLFTEQENKTIFKWVISEEADVIEIGRDFGNYITPEQTVLMPAGSSQEELKQTRDLVSKICIDKGLRYSDRLHVVIWNLKTGV